MDIELINGRFSIAEAEQLLSAIVKVKISFHEEKIRTIHQTEEDIKHSEKRIVQLQEKLRVAIQKLKENHQPFTRIQAHIEVGFPPDIGQ
ncbi:MAG: hypothetical protein KGO92_01730 [Bacteroidota bacterium]|jgi:uncharacterized protein (DUF342 family)|nr:hypothetical protein [Bacteroidota bacterium]